MENTPAMHDWLTNFDLDHPLVIAGPCSAETEEQVLKIAHELMTPMSRPFVRVFGSQGPVLEILKG